MVEAEQETKPFIVWSIATHQLALPLEAVLRVINYPSNVNSDLAQMGFVQIRQSLIKVIDLYQHMGLERSQQLVKGKPILVITSSPEAKLYGILTYEPPTLMNFSRGMIQALPKMSQQTCLLDVVSHAVVIKQEQSSGAVFLLSMKQVLEKVA